MWKFNTHITPLNSLYLSILKLIFRSKISPLISRDFIFYLPVNFSVEVSTPILEMNKVLTVNSWMKYIDNPYKLNIAIYFGRVFQTRWASSLNKNFWKTFTHIPTLTSYVLLNFHFDEHRGESKPNFEKILWRSIRKRDISIRIIIFNDYWSLLLVFRMWKRGRYITFIISQLFL